MDQQIPDKLYFKIGEVAQLTGVKPHVLRYWEAEIAAIRPNKSRNQQRLYRQRDIELILRLKDLLYHQGYTIAGARRALRRKSSDAALPLDESLPTAPQPVEPQPAPPAPVAAEPAVAPDGQMFLPLGPAIDRRLLQEVRQALVALRDTLVNAP